LKNTEGDRSQNVQIEERDDPCSVFHFGIVLRPPLPLQAGFTAPNWF
jgi:hypothetical protein